MHIETPSGSRKEAIDICNKGLARSPYHRGMLAERCNFLRLDQKFEEALEDAHTLVDNHNYWDKSFHNRGLCWKDMKRFDEALLDFDEVTRINPDHGYAHFFKAYILFEKKDLDRALVSYQKAHANLREGVDRNRAICNIAEISIQKAKKAEQWHEMIRLAEQEIKLSVPSGQLHMNNMYFWLGYGLKRIGKMEEAISAYSSGLEDHDRFDCYYNRGRIYMSQCKWKKALCDFQSAIPCRADDPANLITCHLLQHEMLLNLALFEKALEAITASRQMLLPIVDFEVEASYGSSLYHLGDYDEAVQVYTENVLPLCSKDESKRGRVLNWISCCRFGHATIAYEHEVWEDVVRYYPEKFQEYGVDLKDVDSLNKLDPAFVHPNRIREYGEALHHLDQHEKAVEIFNLVLKLSDAFQTSLAIQNIRWYKILSLMDLGRNSDALVDANVYVNTYKDFHLIFWQRSIIHFRLENFSNALSDLLKYIRFDKSLDLKGEDPLWIAQVYDRVGRYEYAAIAYEFVLETSSNANELKLCQKNYQEMKPPKKEVQVSNKDSKIDMEDYKLVQEWPMERVLKWIRSQSCRELRIYLICFEAHEISGRQLLNLRDGRLHTMGIQSADHRKQFLTQIHTLCPDHKQDDASSHTCCVCYDKPVSICFSPCRHANTCQDCATRVTQCPICRALITKKETIYL
jgi:tetratricopeptide (TPR) repeat protein